MRAIAFTLQSGITAEEKEITLTAIQAAEGILSAALLLPDDDDPDIARTGYAYVDAATDAAATGARLAAISGVESVSVSGDRYLR